MLDGLQSLLADVYHVDLEHDVRDFLVTDPRFLSLSTTDDGRVTREKLLVHQDGDDLDLALFLDDELLARLAERDPVAALGEENLADFCLALEGVSHFVYLAWNARADRSVTLLEMELQAEIDKYITARVLLARQQSAQLDALFQRLFAAPLFDDDLSPGELQRYRDATRYAGAYVRSLESRFEPGHPAPEMTRELRDFWRLPQPDKLSHINRAQFA
jgi:hypothetical protein